MASQESSFPNGRAHIFTEKASSCTLEEHTNMPGVPSDEAHCYAIAFTAQRASCQRKVLLALPSKASLPKQSFVVMQC